MCHYISLPLHYSENATARLRNSKQPHSPLWVHLLDYNDTISFIRRDLQVPEGRLFPHPEIDKTCLCIEMRHRHDVQSDFFTIFIIHYFLEGLRPVLDQPRIHCINEQILPEWEVVLFWLGSCLYRFYWHSNNLKPICWTSLNSFIRINLRWIWRFDWNYASFGRIFSWSMRRHVHQIDIKLLENAFSHVSYGFCLGQCDSLSSIPNFQNSFISNRPNQLSTNRSAQHRCESPCVQFVGCLNDFHSRSHDIFRLDIPHSRIYVWEGRKSCTCKLSSDNPVLHRWYNDLWYKTILQSGLRRPHYHRNELLSCYSKVHWNN